MILSCCRWLRYYLTAKNSASPANNSSWLDYWIVFSRMISGELSTSKAFAILLGAKSAQRVPLRCRCSDCNRVPLPSSWVVAKVWGKRGDQQGEVQVLQNGRNSQSVEVSAALKLPQMWLASMSASDASLYIAQMQFSDWIYSLLIFSIAAHRVPHS